jgi:hypothetical protein
VSEPLEFLSPDLATPDLTPAATAWRSPLERALSRAPLGISDISLTGTIEVRGDLDELDPEGFELVRITPTRGLVLCDFPHTAQLRERLSERFFTVDMSGALAGLQVRGVMLMRRVTDLDLDDCPVVGPVAHVQTYVFRDSDESFRLFFAQEYADYVAEVVLDAAEGVR